MKYNHMFDLAFTIESEEEYARKIGEKALMAALLRRIADLADESDGDIKNAVGYCDSYEIEEEE